MVPEGFRPSGLQRYFDPSNGVGPVEQAWRDDEFVLDPTRVTLHVGRTGMDGDTFRKLLMDEYDIHINKTSRNTVLFLLHIGMGRGTIAQLIKTLGQIARDLDRRATHASPAEQAAFEADVRSLCEYLPPLPNFSRFHESFQPDPNSGTPEGDIRRAFFQAYDSSACQFVPLDSSLKQAVADGAEFVSAGFVTPYPPGFPVLVPGQVVSESIVDYLLALDVKEIHGFDPELGLRVFTVDSLKMSSGRGNGATKQSSPQSPRVVAAKLPAAAPPLAATTGEK
jgi:arginine decarboxylase